MSVLDLIRASTLSQAKHAADSVSTVIRRELRRARAVPARKLYSYRQCDVLLPARHGTTSALVERGLIRAVQVGKRMKVPASEIARISEEGWNLDRPTRRRVRALRSVKTVMTLNGADTTRAVGT